MNKACRAMCYAEFKVRVARGALEERKTIAWLAAQFDIHPNQISQWKKQLLDALPDVFSRRRKRDRKSQEELTARLYRQEISGPPPKADFSHRANRLLREF